MVCKQRKYALKQASLVLERFIEQLVVDVNLTGLPFDIGINGDILNQFKHGKYSFYNPHYIYFLA